MQEQMVAAMASKTILDERELKSEIMDQLEEAVDNYLSSFKLAGKGNGSLPTIDDIENLVRELKSKTRDIYLDMVSNSLDTFDETELIASKKASTNRKE